MAEVLIAFDEPIAARDGARYRARVCGRPDADGLWEGWVEFEPVAEGPTIPSPRETQQPNRTDLLYWATGLSVAYLEGALARARRAAEPPRVAAAVPAAPVTVPAPAAPHTAPAPRAPHALIDPFAVHAQGEDVLRQELLALSTDHLNSIIAAYGLDADVGLPPAASHDTRVAAIVAAVRARAGGGDAGRSSSRPAG